MPLEPFKKVYVRMQRCSLKMHDGDQQQQDKYVFLRGENAQPPTILVPAEKWPVADGEQRMVKEVCDQEDWQNVIFDVAQICWKKLNHQKIDGDHALYLQMHGELIQKRLLICEKEVHLPEAFGLYFLNVVEKAAKKKQRRH